MKAVLVNFNHTPTWLLESGLDYYIYDRSDSKDYLKDFPQERIRYTRNVGNVDYDKLSYLVEFYDNLPDVFLWGKTNLFKYITPKEWEKIKDNQQFTPVFTSTHKVYSDRMGMVNFYGEGIYWERNDDWYLNEQPARFRSFTEWAQEFQLPRLAYIPFAPGGNYILTKERVHRYSRDFYEKMMNTMPYAQLPGEAQLAERSYFLMWR